MPRTYESYNYDREHANYDKVGTSDLRVQYCYARIRTATLVRTMPDLIEGSIVEDDAIMEEYRQFESVTERKEFIDNFDPSTYTPKQITKRNLRGMGVDKVIGTTRGISAEEVKVSQVKRNRIVK